MPFQVNTRESAQSNAISIEATRVLEGDSQLNIIQVVPAATTNQEILAAIDISLAKLVAIRSTQNITIKTNNSGTPDDTLVLTANIPMIWRDGDYNALFLTDDVAKFFITNATASPATVQILALVDLP
jgi:hypothetical protein